MYTFSWLEVTKILSVGHFSCEYNSLHVTNPKYMLDIEHDSIEHEQRTCTIIKTHTVLN